MNPEGSSQAGSQKTAEAIQLTANTLAGMAPIAKRNASTAKDPSVDESTPAKPQTPASSKPTKKTKAIDFDTLTPVRRPTGTSKASRRIVPCIKCAKRLFYDNKSKSASVVEKAMHDDTNGLPIVESLSCVPGNTKCTYCRVTKKPCHQVERKYHEKVILLKLRALASVTHDNIPDAERLESVESQRYIVDLLENRAELSGDDDSEDDVDDASEDDE